MNFKNNSQYQILTPNGWSDFKGLNQIKSNSYINFILSTNQTLCCTLNHRLKLNSGQFKLAHQIKLQDVLYKDVYINQIQRIQDGQQKSFFDVSNVQLESQYYSQGVISHNCGGDCITGDSIVTIKNQNTDQIQNITIQQLAYKCLSQFNLKILTPLGWSTFQGVRKVPTKRTILITTQTKSIECTLDHKLKTNNGSFQKAINLNIGDVLYNNQIIKDVKVLCQKKYVYDATNVTLNHQYYANGIVVSNCILLSTPRGCVVGNTPIIIKNMPSNLPTVISIKDVFNYNLKYYTVLTPNGWQKFKGVRQKNVNIIYTLIIDHSLILRCSQDHLLKIKDGSFKQVKQMNINQQLAQNKIVTFITTSKVQQKVYDLIDVQNGNQYYTNGLISHNCGHTFHKLWVQAQQGLNPFNTIKLPWYRHPQRDQQWRDKQTKAVGQKQSARQYDCSFASSGDTVLNDTLLNTLQQQFCLNPIQMHCNQKLWIWKHPQQGKNYIISADVARGDGGDYSAFHIICVQDDQQVGQYKGKINTKDYGQLLVQWATKYNMAQLIVQNANIGWAVLQQIIDLQYKNLYYHKKDFKYVDTQLHSKMKRTKSSDLQKDILGFSTTSKTRPLIIQKTMLLLQTKQFIIRSKRLINQLRTFIWINGRAQAMGSYNDDLTMSLCIGVWVRNTSYMLKKQASALTRQKLANINSGLNLRGQAQKKVTSGFYSGANTSDKNVISIGGQNINIADFYFKK